MNVPGAALLQRRIILTMGVIGLVIGLLFLIQNTD